MIKNNKGVTLIELLIVIVVMGIIAAFAVPAVGTIITNTKQDAVVADALAIENAAKLYCASTSTATCDTDDVLSATLLEEYVEGISWGVADDATSDYIATSSSATKQADGSWSVLLTPTVENEPGYSGVPSGENPRTNVTP